MQMPPGVGHVCPASAQSALVQQELIWMQVPLAAQVR
jgi:hypothetical protein